MTNLTVAGTKDHPITIGPIAERVRVVWRGRTIGGERQALDLAEASYPAGRLRAAHRHGHERARAHRPGHDLSL